MPFRLVTLGGLSLLDAESGRRLAVPRKALALMAVLAGAGARGAGRERILSLLWPDAGDSGRGALKQTVYELRRTLGDRGVLTGTAELTLDADQLTSDIGDLESAYSAGQWARVVELYSGPFLDQFYIRGSAEFEHWADSRRGHYKELFSNALSKSADAAVARGDVHGAVALWRRLAAEDPFSARGALGLMTALAAAGDAAGALAHYRVHRQLLHDELGAQPDATVTVAAERMRARNGQTGPATVLPASPDPADAPEVTGEPAGRAVAGRGITALKLPGAIMHRHSVWLAVTLLIIAAGTLAAALRTRGKARVLASIQLPPNSASRVSVHAHLNRIYVDGGASFDHALTVVDGDSYKARRLPHGSGVVTDPTTDLYWTGDYGGKFVVVRNGRTDSLVGRVTVPGCPHTMIIGDGRTWVAQQCDDHISVFDNRTRAVIRHIPIPTLSRAEVGGAKGMGEILINRNTGIIYFWKDMIPHRLDPRSWLIEETVDFGGPIIGINDPANHLYARIDNGLQVIDGASEKIVAHVRLPSTPLRMAVGFGGHKVYAVTLEGLFVVDGTSHEASPELSFGGGFIPADIAVDDARGRAYVLGRDAAAIPWLKVVELGN